MFSLIEEHRSKKEFSISEEKAVKLFDLQADAIRNIRDTEGYKQIKEFLGRERDAALKRLMTTKKDDLPDVKALLAVTDRLLTFLSSRENGSPRQVA